MPPLDATPDQNDNTPQDQPNNGAPASSPQTSATATPNMPSDNPQTTEPEAPEYDFHKLVPVEFQQKPYMKEVDSFEKLFKDFDNAQSLIGQRQAVVPKPDAPPEEWDAYLEKVRPESTDAYEFPETEYTKKFGQDEEFRGQMKELFHKAGLSPYQVKTLAEGYDAALFSRMEAKAKEAETQAADFEKLADGLFGDAKDEKLKRANEILKENTPEEMKPYLQNLSNENLAIMTSILNSFHDKYMAEDDLNTGAKGSGADADGLRDQAQQLMASPAYKDFRHPKHDATVKQVNELYDKIGKMSS